VTQQKLDLLQFTAGHVAHSCAATPVMPHAAKCRAFLAQRRGGRKLNQEAKVGGRDGELKMDWTEPLREVRPMGIECLAEG